MDYNLGKYRWKSKTGLIYKKRRFFGWKKISSVSYSHREAISRISDLDRLDQDTKKPETKDARK